MAHSSEPPATDARIDRAGGDPAGGDDSGPTPHGITFREALGTWTHIGLNSFGGPAGQIAVMHKVLVEQKRWISEQRFLHALNYCMLLPGPEAQQLAVYIGWLLHGTAGGLAAGILFVLPGMLAVLALSILYAGWGRLTLVSGLFFGLKPAVLAIVIEAVIRIGKRALKNGTLVGLAGLAFLLIFFGGVPFPLIVLGAGLTGLLGARVAPARFAPLALHAPKGRATSGNTAAVRGGTGAAATVDALLDESVPAHCRPSAARAVRTAATCLILWLGPVLALAWFAGADSVYTQIGAFFSRAAVVTFGGAYAVLAYVAQQAVERFHWMAPGEMLDGLGLAETTPGPLIMVVQFVGFLAAFRAPGPLSPMLGGTAGALLTTWVTFVPCFLWIFLGAPWIEALRGQRALNAALSAITAAVVGVILNLAVWFALHTLFRVVDERHIGPLRLLVPDLATLDAPALGIAIFALLATFRWKLGMLKTLGACAAAGAAWTLLAA